MYVFSDGLRTPTYVCMFMKSTSGKYKRLEIHYFIEQK